MGINEHFHLNFHRPFSSARIILIFSEYSFSDEYDVCFFRKYTYTHFRHMCVYTFIQVYIYTHTYTHVYRLHVYIFLCAPIHTCTHNVLWFIFRLLM